MVMPTVFEKLPGIIAELEAKAGGVTNFTRHLRKQLADLEAKSNNRATDTKQVTYFSGTGPSQPEPKKPEGEVPPS